MRQRSAHKLQKREPFKQKPISNKHWRKSEPSNGQRRAVVLQHQRSPKRPWTDRSAQACQKGPLLKHLLRSRIHLNLQEHLPSYPQGPQLDNQRRKNNYCSSRVDMRVALLKKSLHVHCKLIGINKFSKVSSFKSLNTIFYCCKYILVKRNVSLF